jgi:hypothetical protein
MRRYKKNVLVENANTRTRKYGVNLIKVSVMGLEPTLL